MFCSRIQSITLPASVKEIGDSAFQYCQSLTSINLQECTQLESIGDMTFVGCSSLQSIVIPASVTSIGANAFVSTSLTSLIFENTIGWQISQDGQNDWTDLDVDLSVLENALDALTNTYASYYWRRVEA